MCQLERTKRTAGTIVVLVFLFGLPAVLIRVSMDDVPERSMTKVVTVYQEAIETVDHAFARHRNPDSSGRLSPLPDNSRAWIELLNPYGRKAPGGGLAIKRDPDYGTGAIGIHGDEVSVTITMPAYRDLKGAETVITAKSGILEHDAR